MNPKISVIVPMYNVEKYIRMCIESILNQTFKDFELILVDDASTDKTLEIAKSFVDSRIKIIENQINSGFPAVSRNIGLAQAQGEYVYFMDDDDVILPKALELLVNAIEKSEADVAGTNVHLITDNNDFQNLNETTFEMYRVGTTTDVSADINIRLIDEYCNLKSTCLIWRKMYRHKFLKDHNIKFRKLHCEDEFFLIDILCTTSKIYKFDKPFYIHRNLQGSGAHPETSNLNKLRDRIRNLLSVNSFLTNLSSTQLSRGGYYHSTLLQ